MLRKGKGHMQAGTLTARVRQRLRQTVIKMHRAALLQGLGSCPQRRLLRSNEPPSDITPC